MYSGSDPVTGRAHYLIESTKDEKQAAVIMRRLLTEVDEQRNPRTKATLGAALDAWLRVHEAEPNTLKGYEVYVRRHIKPALGEVPIGKINAQLLEEFYTQLRKCRVRCNGRVPIDHRVDGQHECRIVRHKRGPGSRRCSKPRLRGRRLRGAGVSATHLPAIRARDHSCLSTPGG